ncbi:MAG: hypothetical protein ACRBCK_11565 [Alphaproteobacteria bacterium]
MGLFRANDRLYPDPMILDIGDDIEALSPIWREKTKHNIHAIICDYPGQGEDLDHAAQDIINSSKMSNNCFSPEMAGNRHTGHASFTTWNNVNTLKTSLSQKHFPHAANEVITNIAKTLVQTQSAPEYSTLIRVNSDRIRGVHRHDEDGDDFDDTITMTLSGDGTIAQAGEKPGDDIAFALPSRKIILFDCTLLHGSPERQENWDSNPRTNIIMAPV